MNSFNEPKTAMSGQLTPLFALLYLLLPNMLFLLGWVRLPFALPLCIALLLGTFVVWYRSRREVPCCSCYTQKKKGNEIALGITLLFALLLTEMIGFHGHAMQSGDFHVKNPIYLTLIQDSWPVFSERGEYFIYYHAIWLPAALLCKLCGGVQHSASILFIWTYLGLFLSILLLYRRLGSKVLWFFILLYFLGNISELPNALYVSLKDSSNNFATQNVIPVLELMGFGPRYRYLHFMGSLGHQFNVAVPLLLCISLMLSKSIPERYYFLPSAFFVLLSPLSAIALLPYLGIVYLTKLRLVWVAVKMPLMWICCLLLICVACYFCGQTGSEIRWVWSDSPYFRDPSYHPYTVFCESSFVRFIRYLYVVCGMLIPVFLFIPKRMRRNRLFIYLLVLIVMLPLIWIGRKDNVFMAKGSSFLFIVFSWLLMKRWKYSSVAMCRALVIFVALSSLHVVSEIKRMDLLHYGWDAATIRRHTDSSWDGTLNHPDKYEYSQFFGRVTCPLIQLTAGERSFIH